MRKPPKDIHEILSGIVEAFNKLHDNNIFHNDIKDNNIMVEETWDGYSIRIIDFGHANVEGGRPYRFEN